MIGIDKDAFSSGQISSKLWLCEELEQTGWKVGTINIYGGWYGTLAFLLLARNKFKFDRIESYDIDPACESVADMINENWVWQGWKFKAFTADCNTLKPKADLIINTSTEHFDSMDWFNNIPKGTKIILQGNNMNHFDHTSSIKSLDEFVKKYPLSLSIYRNKKSFVYPDWSFDRYMIIGVK